MIDQESLKSIEDLHRLKTEGIITEAEFDKAKADILSGSTTRRPKPHIPTAQSNFQLASDLPRVDDLVSWAMRPLQLYATFTGRSTRKEFWTYILALAVVMLLISMFVAIDEYGPTGRNGELVLALLIVATAVPSFAVQARRFHDQDLSGWLVLLNIIPYLGSLIVFVFMLRDGTPGENRFGPDPKGREPLPAE
ncbi:DUF805 domain-containing protein [Novosphingobium sp. JCM 18896]|uniref:DUF805 domain-containing protein n=1 Tax=Novosphingobium sp. JCM 18896 TaxID=2989731 RepID=UPI0022231185|nr:DUF805 domain-containing protein [Novosphingobium sp. JCM 18896]MCW1431877.1 DUF805 domain-containing protein [Novosphingobium sp. JCM 18896]